MQTGSIISGAAHAGLLVWVIFGGVFKAEPLPVEIATVAIVTSSEYAELLAAQQPPNAGAQPAALQVPDTPSETIVEPSAAEDPPPAREDPNDTRPPEPTPDVPTVPAAPETPQAADVTDSVSEITPPDPVVDAPTPTCLLYTSDAADE